MLNGVDTEIIDGVALCRPGLFDPVRLPFHHLFTDIRVFRQKIWKASKLAPNFTRSAITKHSVKASSVLICREVRHTAAVTWFQSITSVIQHHINHDFNAAFMCRINHFMEIRHGTEMRVQFPKIIRPIAVVSIIWCIRSFAVSNIKFDIIDNRTDPDRIDSKLVQVIKLLRDPLKISALVCTRLACVIANTMRVIVR